MSSTNKQLNDKALAILALRASRVDAEFFTPSDEELAQLIDADTAPVALSETRKAQVLDAIANDPETHQRWTAMVETSELLGLGGFSNSTVLNNATNLGDQNAKNTSLSPGLEGDSQAKNGFFASVLDWFRQPLGQWSGGIGFAVTAAVLAVVFLPSAHHSKIDDLYKDYGNDWVERPTPLTNLRNLQSNEDQKLDGEQAALLSGIYDGLDQLGAEFTIPMLAARDLALNPELIETDAQHTLFGLGRLVALTNFKCHLGSEPAFYENSFELYELLSQMLEQQGKAGSVSESLKQLINRPGDSEMNSCRISKTLLKGLS